MNTQSIRSSWLVVGLTVACLASANVAEARNRNPRVLPPQSTPNDKSYGEWAVAWWQWELSIPADRSPVTDTTGEFAGEGQSGPVWFVAGTFAPSVERSFTVPNGKALFVPVYVWIFGAGAFDCDPSVPGVPCDVPALQATAAANVEADDLIMEVVIDNVPVKNVRGYRTRSPAPFPITYPENSVTGLPAGIYYPQIADGYWLMLAPLRKGGHEIDMHVTAPTTSNGPLEFDETLHITVE